MILNNVPKHIAFIMDGNSRWAKARSLPTIAGHRAGIKAAEEILKRASELGVKYLTLFTFSSENWNRDQEWVSEFMGLLRWYLSHSASRLAENDVRIKVIGDRSNFAPDLKNMLDELEKNSENNSGITVILALSYGGKDDIKRAVQKISQKVKQGDLEIEDINEELISQNLDTAEIPDPDLMIRTSGEMRISNFLLWQMAYTEYVFFEDCFWPDFSPKHLDIAVEQYSKRQRRYGLFSVAA